MPVFLTDLVGNVHGLIRAGVVRTLLLLFKTCFLCSLSYAKKGFKLYLNA
jgi:hypothetical protein